MVKLWSQNPNTQLFPPSYSQGLLGATMPWIGEGNDRQPILVFLLAEPHGQRRLVGHHPGGHKELHMTKWQSSPGGSDGKESPAMKETWVRSLGWEDPLEKGRSTHSSMLPWKSMDRDYSPWGRKELDTTEWLMLSDWAPCPPFCGFDKYCYGGYVWNKGMFLNEGIKNLKENPNLYPKKLLKQEGRYFKEEIYFGIVV